MTCPKCKSPNVSTQIVTETMLKDKHHGIFWWLFIGFWWVPIKWLFLTVPALLVKLFGHKKQKLKQKNKTMCVCQNCGYTWKI